MRLQRGGGGGGGRKGGPRLPAQLERELAVASGASASLSGAGNRRLSRKDQRKEKRNSKRARPQPQERQAAPHRQPAVLAEREREEVRPAKRPRTNDRPLKRTTMPLAQQPKKQVCSCICNCVKLH
jgi:hypothetical protein